MKKQKKNKKLTKKQEAFVSEYVIDFNATAAAIRAGYSKKTAKEAGYENLTKPHIKEAVDGLIEKRKKKLVVTEQMIINELASIAFAEIKIVGVKGKIMSLELLGKHLGMWKADQTEKDIRVYIKDETEQK